MLMSEMDKKQNLSYVCMLLLMPNERIRPELLLISLVDSCLEIVEKFKNIKEEFCIRLILFKERDLGEGD